MKVLFLIFSINSSAGQSLLLQRVGRTQKPNSTKASNQTIQTWQYEMPFRKLRPIPTKAFSAGWAISTPNACIAAPRAILANENVSRGEGLTKNPSPQKPFTVATIEAAWHSKPSLCK
jgi:hypothetical protein